MSDRRDSTKSRAWDELKEEYALNDPDEPEQPVDEWDPEEEPETEASAPPLEPAAASRFGETAKSALLCGALILISIYEAITKKRAIKEASFDLTSLLVSQAVVSIVVGTGMAVFYGQTHILFGDPKFFAVQLAKYAPIGLLFTVAACVQMIALFYLAADVFKVLEQARLLMTAVFAFFVFRRKISISSWVALISITLVSVSYALVRSLTKDSQTLSETLGFFQEAARGAHDSEKGKVMQAKVLGGVQRLMTSGDQNELFAAHVSKNVIESNPILNPTNAGAGYALTALFILLSCSAATYAELVLKGGAHVPFYIQKVYCEIPAGIVSVCVSAWIFPLLVENGIAVKMLKINMFEDGFFCGWGNSWVISCFFLMILKSWLSGIICKQLSSLSKQLCSITAVVCLYFVMLVHMCPNDEGKLGGPGAPFFCPANLGQATTAVVVADLTVLCSVVSYVTAQRDKQRKTMYKKQYAEVDEERKALLSRGFFPQSGV